MSTVDRRTLRRARHALGQTWRTHLIRAGAIEVTTPVLHRYPDIAPIRQFVTTHPTTGEQACLRIAPTEHLKRLLADGEQQIFEFASNFRDDIRDCTHLSEFMSLEYMVVNGTCSGMENLAIELCSAATAALAELASDGPPAWADALAAGTFTRISIADLPSIDVDQLNLDAIDRAVTEHARVTGGVVLMGDFPRALGGPAASHADKPGFKQRTELYIDGLEIANMSSTLTDPISLRAWHDAGLRHKAELSIYPNERDIALFEAVTRGIPPSAVIGLGVERFLQAYFSLENMSQEFYNGY